jgi:hypothetical protein
MTNDKIKIEDLPLESTRSDWSRRLKVPLRKLVYETQMGRLSRGRNVGWLVMLSREDILAWLKTRQGRKFFVVNGD